MRSSQKDHLAGVGKAERSPGVGSLFSEPRGTAEGFFKLQANMTRFVFCQDQLAVV